MAGPLTHTQPDPCPRRRRPTQLSPPPPMDDEDLIAEILSRLPALPSALPHAALVCRLWRRVVAEPHFLRRFRAHHRKPPLLGFFSRAGGGQLRFDPALDPPDRIPAGRFSLRRDDALAFRFVGCRHGLVLLLNLWRSQILVWDPVTGDQRLAPFPLELDADGVVLILSGAVVCAAGDPGHVHGSCHSGPFRVALVATARGFLQLFACIYSSETGLWSSISLAHELPVPPNTASCFGPSTLAGDSLYWILSQDGGALIQLELDKQRLSVIDLPLARGGRYATMLTEDGVLRLVLMSTFHVQLWRREPDCSGVDAWVPEKNIELDMVPSLRSLSPVPQRARLISGAFDEDNGVIFVWTASGVFMVQLHSMRLKKLSSKMDAVDSYHPFTSFCPAGQQHLCLCQLSEPILVKNRATSKSTRSTSSPKHDSLEQAAMSFITLFDGTLLPGATAQDALVLLCIVHTTFAAVGVHDT